MKNIFKFLFISVLLSCTIMSCTKEEAIDYYLGGTNPVLSSSLTGTIPLSYATASSKAVSFNWTNPNYSFQTGVSSQNVTYTLQIDTTGSNFSNPNLKSIPVTTDLGVTILQSELNDYLLNTVVLKPGIPHNIELRVISSLTNNSAKLSSNVLKFVVTPYAIPPKVTPPGTAASGYTDGQLFITGSATPGNWMGGGDAPLLSQQFTQISSTVYEIILQLSGGNSYTFVPKYGDWNTKYSIAKKNDPAEVNGGDFQVGGEDILAPAASGKYKVQVDFQRGKFTVTAQ